MYLEQHTSMLFEIHNVMIFEIGIIEINTEYFPLLKKQLLQNCKDRMECLFKKDEIICASILDPRQKLDILKGNASTFRISILSLS